MVRFIGGVMKMTSPYYDTHHHELERIERDYRAEGTHISIIRANRILALLHQEKINGKLQ